MRIGEESTYHDPQKSCRSREGFLAYLWQQEQRGGEHLFPFQGDIAFIIDPPAEGPQPFARRLRASIRSVLTPARAAALREQEGAPLVIAAYPAEKRPGPQHRNP